jgi:hypothetical protein
MQIILADRTEHDLARVYTHPKLQSEPFLAPQSLGLFSTFLLHQEGRVEGALRVILVSNGRAKQSKDAVAHGLGHVTFIAMNSVHHTLQRRVKNGASFLRVEIVDEICGAFDIGKEGGDTLALAIRRASGCHGFTLGQNPLG